MSTSTTSDKVLADPPEDKQPVVTSSPDTPKALVPEIKALTTCLKNIVLHAAHISSFHADAQRLNITAYAPEPPRSLTSALGREVEKYDQICDLIDAQLRRSINGLKNELRQEEERIEAEEKKRKMESAMLPPPVPQSAVQSEDATTDGEGTHSRNSPITPMRRPSAISISSLQRPQFPLKLDLSASSFRISEEEASAFSKGLASPVTLAPKSARPVDTDEFPSDFMSFTDPPLTDDMTGSNDMHMTLPPDMHGTSQLPSMGMDMGLGDSSDKPIELDLESMDLDVQGLFGSATEGGDSNDGLFSPALDDGNAEAPSGERGKQEDSALDSFENVSNVNDELFGDFDSGGDLHNAASSLLNTDPTTMPSPSALIAQFNASSQLMDLKPPNESASATGTSPAFDLNQIDLTLDSGFFSNPPDSDMNFSMDFYMDAVGEEKPNINPPQNPS